MKPAVIIPEMRDILAVVEHINREGKNPDEITIFKELHESNQHHGWELEAIGVFVYTTWLSKRGYLRRYFGGQYQITEKGRQVFGGAPV